MTGDLWKVLPSDLEVILFDLDGTLRHNNPSADQALYDRAVELGAKDGLDKRRNSTRWVHYYWAQSAELKADLKTYGETSDEFWQNYILRSMLIFGCDKDCATQLVPELYHFMQVEYQPEDVVPQGVSETLKALKDIGFRLGVLSNRNRPCHEHLQSLGLDNYFEMAIVAGEAASWKPDPGIFHQALQRMLTAPKRAIYVGDNYFSDVFGARNAGIQPVLIDPARIFPDADCPVITQICDLHGLVEWRSSK